MFSSFNQVVAVAPYKLAFMITKNKMSFSKCEAVIKFARSADPESKVFSSMASSRKTITTKACELHVNILQPELKQLVVQSPFWSLMVDESTDSSTKEQMAMYVRCVDLMQKRIVTKFLHLQEIRGHPDAPTLCSAIMEVIESEFPVAHHPVCGLSN